MTRHVSRTAALMLAIACADLAQAEAPASDVVKAAEEARAEAEARTAFWIAKQAEYEAQAAAAKAQFAGLDGLNPAAGSAELAGKGGEIEAEMLATLAARRAAMAIVEGVKGKATGTILLLAPDETITPDAWYGFQAKALGVAKAMRAQGCPAPIVPASRAEPSAAEASLPGVLAAVNVAAKLFRSDLKVSGVAVSARDDLLLRAVGAALTAEPGRVVMLPSASAANVLTADNPVMKTMGELDSMLQCIDDRLVAATGAKAAGQREALEAERARHAAFVADVTEPTQSGAIELVEAARQAAWATTLGSAHVLRVEAHTAGGSLFTKTNLWTALGVGKPFQISSGLVASYELTRPSTGQLVAAGSVACASGFHRITDAHRTVNGSLAPARVTSASMCRHRS